MPNSTTAACVTRASTSSLIEAAAVSAHTLRRAVAPRRNTLSFSTPTIILCGTCRARMYAAYGIVVSEARRLVMRRGRRVVLDQIWPLVVSCAIMLMMIDLSERTKEQGPNRRIGHILDPGCIQTTRSVFRRKRDSSVYWLHRLDAGDWIQLDETKGRLLRSR